MLTLDQAMHAQDFHFGMCKKVVGPRGGVKYLSQVWRRSGKTQTWKTRPGHFRIPIKLELSTAGALGYHQIKFALSTSGAIWNHQAHLWHTPDDCPLNVDENTGQQATT